MGEKKGKNTVFYVSLIIVGIIAVWSVAFNDSFTVVANAAFKVLTTDFGWLYLISMIIFFGFIVYFAFGKYLPTYLLTYVYSMTNNLTEVIVPLIELVVICIVLFVFASRKVLKMEISR